MPSERGPVCVSVINMKGGVGKTTTVALLGRHAAYADVRVLVVDLDPQANLSQAYMGNAYVQFLESEEPSIVEVFDGYRPPTQERESPTRLDPEDTVREVYDDGTLSYIPSRFDFSDNLVRAVKPDPQVLARYIADHFQEKDLVLIDCPPTESVFTRAAYHASRYVLVPVRPEYFATVGFPYSQNPSTHSEPRTRLTTLRLSALLSTMDSMTEETTGDPKNAVPCQKYLKRRTRTAGMYLRNRSPTHAAFPSSCAGIGVGVVTPGASICLPRSSSSVSVSKKTTDATT